jgi:hypothetical protein
MSVPSSSPNPLQFATETGQELFQVLLTRAGERLEGVSDMDRFMALLSAAVVPVAEVLRVPVGRGRDRGATADKLIATSGGMIRSLLEDVIAGAQH